jgi:CheY-like chemotaxis protein
VVWRHGLSEFGLTVCQLPTDHCDAGNGRMTARLPDLRARILVVDDQEDVRQMLTLALEFEGHRVDAAANAHEGLNRLRGARYNLVLTDYAMPGGSGVWMLQEATRLGLLADTAAVIVTAHPHVQDVSGIPIISKPLDLDRFLDQVRSILGGSAGDGNGEAVRVEASPGNYRVELVLYISSSSPASIQARRNLERLLARFDPAQVKCSVCDLGREPLAGEEDRIAFTPTLVKRLPEPRMWVLGNLRETDVLSDLLRVCGVDAKA